MGSTISSDTGVISFTDSVAFMSGSPTGLNRGGLSSVLEA